MTSKVNLNIQTPIHWPEHCAVCGAEPSAWVISRCSIVVGVGYYIVVWTRKRRIVELRYPVCKRHEFLATLAGLISQRSLLNLAAGVLIFYAGLIVFGALGAMIRSGRLPESSEVLLWCSAIFIGGTAAGVWASRFTPVKIMGAKGDTITIKIASAHYAGEFLGLNGTAVSK